MTREAVETRAVAVKPARVAAATVVRAGSRGVPVQTRQALVAPPQPGEIRDRVARRALAIPAAVEARRAEVGEPEGVAA